MLSRERLLRSRLKLRQLAALIAIADAGSLRAAAAALGLSQPALSKTLRELESVFERPLFARESRGLRQTPHGAAAIAYARRLMQDLGALAQELDAVDAGAGGRLRIGVIPYVATDWLHRALGQMLAAPPVALQVVEGATDELVARLRRRELDCVVGRVTPSLAGDGLETRRLFRQTLRILVRSGHPLLRARRSPGLRDLAGYEWLLAPATTPTRQLLDQVFVQAGLAPPRVRLETYALPVVQRFVAASDALAAVPNDIAEQCVRHGGFRVLPQAWQLPPVCLVWLARDRDHPLIRRFGDAAALAPPGTGSARA